MIAQKSNFFCPKGYAAITLFGTVFTRAQDLADQLNDRYTTLLNHEQIHLRQAQSCHNSWLLFYLRYGWYFLRALPARKQIKNPGYWLNPFEMEAYDNDQDLDYLKQFDKKGATGWKRFAQMSLKQRVYHVKGNR